MAGTNLICYVSYFDMVCAGNSWLLKFSWFSWFHYRYHTLATHSEGPHLPGVALVD